MNKQKIILFDIDYTLFDTDKFRDIGYKKLAKKLKLKFDKSFKNMIKKAEEISHREIGFYDPNVFIKNVIELSGSNEDIGNLKIEFWRKDNFERSIYQDVWIFLDELSGNNNILIGILSTGESKFQRKKIEALKEVFTEEHIHIFINKLIEIKNVLDKYSNYDLFIADDMTSVLELAKKLRKDVVTVYVNRPKRWESKDLGGFRPDYEIKNLRNLPSIINSS